MKANGKPTEAEAMSAMATLGIDPGAPWDVARNRYRSEIMKVHPDIDAEGSTDRTAALNIAYETLCRFTDSGANPLPAQPTADSEQNRRTVEPQPMVLRTAPGDIFLRLLDGAHLLGDVSYMDPEAGLIQVLLDEGGPNAPQLLITVDVDSDPPVASFTLDSLDSTNAPALPDVVARLGDLLVDGSV